MSSSPALLSRFLRTPYLGQVRRPEPEAGELQVKTVAVALNPTDYKLPPLNVSGGKIVGCDFAGVVTKVGQHVQGFSVGDRVAGALHGGKSNRSGAFSEYLVAPASLSMRVPDAMSLEQAATFPVALLTSALVLHQYLGYPVEGFGDAKGLLAGVDAPLLIWSAASTTGQMMVQLSKILMPLIPVIVTCSPANFKKLRALGADYTFDYNDPNVVANIQETIRNAGLKGVRRAYDAYSEGLSSKLTAKCMTATDTEPAFLVKALPYVYARLPANVHHNYVFAYTAYGEPFSILFFLRYKRSPEDHALAKHVFNTAVGPWISSHGLKAPEVVHINDKDGLGGANATLESIVGEGLPLLQSGRVRGGKIVARFGPDPCKL